MPPPSSPLLTPLRDALDASRFGGKAAQLAEALRAGLPVPDGFAIAWQDVAAVAACERPVRDAIRAQLDALGGAVAVRSSAIGEDSESASFAGVYSSFLNVRSVQGIADAAKAVAASATTDVAKVYRAVSRRIETGVGVVVQRFIAAEVSGVMFTHHPITGVGERVIEASWGLGEGIVGGLVTPDHLRVSRDGTVLELRIGQKDSIIVPGREGGTQELMVAGEYIDVPCLSDADVATLLDLAARCETLRGPRLDIEFSLVAGKVHLLQVRPMTT
jgi:pyruvate,water dikinase